MKIDGVVAFSGIEQSEFTQGQVGLHGDAAWGAFDNVFVGVPFGDQPFNENFADGVRKAGLPFPGSGESSKARIAMPLFRQRASRWHRFAQLRIAPRSLTLRARMLNPYGAAGNRVGIVFNYIATASRVEYNEVVFSPTGIAHGSIESSTRVVQTLATAPYAGGSQQVVRRQVRIGFRTHRHSRRRKSIRGSRCQSQRAPNRSRGAGHALGAREVR